jgi:pimeloyl-ACP methyl ester carboxylesterase
MAGGTFNAEERLSSISAPTLIVHGAVDRVVPVENARLLAERIPHARLVIFDGGGHAFNIELADEFNRLVAEFLRSDHD